MSKSLEVLEHIKTDLDYENNLTTRAKDMFDIVEKELKQAEENEKLLNVFKNALTIEHHDYPMVEPNHSEDVMSYFVKELTTIRQNELDKSMRKALREWVLKNAFPKELKVLAIIRKRTVNVYDEICCCSSYQDYKQSFNYAQQIFNLTREEWELLKNYMNERE